MQLISGRVAAVGAGGDRDLVLARQVRVVAGCRRRTPPPRRRPAARRRARRAARPATGQPVMLRTASPQPPAVVSPAASSRGEDLRERRELEVVELDRSAASRARRRRGRTGSRARRSRAAAPASDAPAGQLDPEHERPDLRLVVVEAPPLQADDVLLGDVGVAGRDQRRQLVEDPERALLALEPLDGVPLEDELEARGAASCRGVCGTGLGVVRERRGVTVPPLLHFGK